MNLLKKYQTNKISDHDFLPPLVAAHKVHDQSFAPILLFIISLMITVFLIWASIAELDEVTHAEGRVIPSSRVQRISHLEGGIIEKILIREGQLVEKGQVLLVINSTVAQARVQEGKNFYYRYLAAVARLRAQVDDKPYVMPSQVAKNAPEIAAQEMTRYDARREKMNSDLAIAHGDIEQRKQEILELHSKRSQYQEQYRLSLEEKNINQPLMEKGLVSKVDFLHIERQAAELKGQFESAEVNIVKAEAAFKQATEKLEHIPLAYHSEDLAELRDAENKLANAQGTVTAEGDRLTRAEVRSPVRGVVNKLLVSTLGGIVRPGEDIVEIVPLDDRLLIEAQVSPVDIATLHPGLKAVVKLTAYDYSIFGGLDAELVEISADTIEDKDKQNRRFFRIQLRTLGNKLSKSKKEVPIIPGMTATVDLLIGKKTVLHYLLKPILKAKQNALTER